MKKQESPGFSRGEQVNRQDLALIATGLYYAEQIYDSASLTARAEGSLTQAAVAAGAAERANLLAFRLGQRPPHTHDYELSGEIQ